MFHHSLDEGKGGRKRVEGGTHTYKHTHTEQFTGKEGKGAQGQLSEGEAHTHKIA